MSPRPTSSQRFPVQHQLDGDFSIDEIRLALGSGRDPSGPGANFAMVVQRARAGAWWCLENVETQRRGIIGDPSTRVDESTVLQAFETAPLWIPPVVSATDALTPHRASEWLELAAHWIAHARTVDDLRYLNTACKLLGASWVHYRVASNDRHTGTAWDDLAEPLATVAAGVGAATDDLRRRLNTRQIVETAGQRIVDGVRPSITTSRRGRPRPRPRLVVLAAQGSRGAVQFLELAAENEVPIAATCWYASSRTSGNQRSSYANAWYPAESALSPSPAGQREPPNVTPPGVESWDTIAEILADLQPDLILLIGMPIVPAAILSLAQLGVVNAHNGALPQYRGMDAVAWALINNDPIICTAHLATPKVDRGDVLATTAVPFWPGATLRARVKQAQLSLLLSLCAFVTSNSRLPDASPQPAPLGRMFYRLHPHLRRVLDASPYGTSDRIDLEQEQSS